MTLLAKDELGNDIAPQVGDKFVRYNRGFKSEPFHGKITAVEEDRISVTGRGYLGGVRYGGWWGDFLSTEHLVIKDRTA